MEMLIIYVLLGVIIWSQIGMSIVIALNNDQRKSRRILISWSVRKIVMLMLVLGPSAWIIVITKGLISELEEGGREVRQKEEK